MLISTSSAHSAMSRLFLTHLHCNLNYSIPFQLKILLYIHELPQAARLPTSTSAFSCHELLVLETLMAAGSTFCSCLYQSCSRDGKNHSALWLHWQFDCENTSTAVSEYTRASDAMFARVHCCNNNDKTKMWHGSTLTSPHSRNYHRPLDKPGHSQQQSELCPPHFFRCICLHHPSKNQKDSYTIPSFLVAESKSFFLTCRYT